jgi:hypothetical protein
MPWFAAANRLLQRGALRCRSFLRDSIRIVDDAPHKAVFQAGKKTATLLAWIF